jgi:hypothetical protein
MFIVNFTSLCFKLVNFRCKNVSNVLQINIISNRTNEMQQGVKIAAIPKRHVICLRILNVYMY